MLFLAKRRSGTAWEDAVSLPEKRPKTQSKSEVSSTSASWTWKQWEPAWGYWQGDYWESDWTPEDGEKGQNQSKNGGQKQQKNRQNATSENGAGTTSVSSSAVIEQSSLPTIPEGHRFSGVVNAIEPKTGNLLIDCPAISQIFGRPPIIRPEENRMNARVGSMVIFALQPGEVETPAAIDVAINGFDTEIGLRPDPVKDDNCDVAGLLPKGNAKGYEGFGKGTSKGKFDQKGHSKASGKGKTDPGKAGKGSPKGSLHTGKGRGKASAHVHSWRT